MKLKYIVKSTYCHCQQYFSYALVSEESGAPWEKKLTDKHDLHKVVLSTPHQRQNQIHNISVVI